MVTFRNNNSKEGITFEETIGFLNLIRIDQNMVLIFQK